MKITEFLSASLVIPDLKGKVKHAVLKEMAEWMASTDQSLDGEKVLQVLLEREKISSTAIGEGVAIPHGKMAGVRRVRGVFGRSREGVDFESIDGALTHLFFVLIAPENSAADHLKALARISRVLKDSAFRSRLMAGRTREEIFQIIEEEDHRF